MLRTPEITPSTVLGEIRAILVAELMARSAPEPVVLSRSVATLLVASLSEQIDRIDVLAESAATADRLVRELKIARIECQLLEQQLIARDLMGLDRPAGAPVSVRCEPFKAAIERGLRARRPAGAVVVDITEALARERRDAGRSTPPTDGGAA